MRLHTLKAQTWTAATDKTLLHNSVVPVALLHPGLYLDLSSRLPGSHTRSWYCLPAPPCTSGSPTGVLWHCLGPGQLCCSALSKQRGIWGTAGTTAADPESDQSLTGTLAASCCLFRNHRAFQTQAAHFQWWKCCVKCTPLLCEVMMMTLLQKQNLLALNLKLTFLLCRHQY